MGLEQEGVTFAFMFKSLRWNPEPVPRMKAANTVSFCMYKLKQAGRNAHVVRFLELCACRWLVDGSCSAFVRVVPLLSVAIRAGVTRRVSVC